MAVVVVVRLGLEAVAPTARWGNGGVMPFSTPVWLTIPACPACALSSHCSRLNKGGLAVAFVNIDPSATFELAFDGFSSSGSHNRCVIHHATQRGQRTPDACLLRFAFSRPSFGAAFSPPQLPAYGSGAAEPHHDAQRQDPGA